MLEIVGEVLYIIHHQLLQPVVKCYGGTSEEEDSKHLQFHACLVKSCYHLFSRQELFSIIISN